MENHQNTTTNSLLVGLASLMSTLFLVSPPFEKNPQQCEMVQSIGKKKQKRLENEPIV
ncbi:hypothetical protein J7E50_07890 [Pedobacter sp. ISL-68]|uniref:hypothetical protein n=1 Tax=unclassified Pedobacter TaxID=2628915 RepID=UPI001BEC0434|nr:MULTISPECIES: hypothetical protein [unclassified Pedobacter]MBT2560753.1 hypothetical protein [Pedobacter sp. ISL-64]MBT2590132.1 hypothetical protein [Pedobacter sp. ISL-68]